VTVTGGNVQLKHRCPDRISLGSATLCLFSLSNSAFACAKGGHDRSLAEPETRRENGQRVRRAIQSVAPPQKFPCPFFEHAALRYKQNSDAK
jgi:hypothetical protein